MSQLFSFIDQNTLHNSISFVSFLFSLGAIILTLGVVWQVERRLDRVYKVFAFGVCAFAISQLLSLLKIVSIAVSQITIDFFNLIFAVLLVVSLFYMHRTLRDVWKEK